MNSIKSQHYRNSYKDSKETSRRRVPSPISRSPKKSGESHRRDSRSTSNRYKDRSNSRSRSQEKSHRRREKRSRSSSREGRKKYHQPAQSSPQNSRGYEQEKHYKVSPWADQRLRTPQQRLEFLKESLSLILKEDTPRKKYDPSRPWDKKKDIIHWGQRKLFLSEVWFLTKYSELGTCVVYAGAAPGTHIPFLSHLFPSLQFILVDPSNFDMKHLGKETTMIEEGTKDYKRNDNKIRAIQGYFDDELATSIAEQHEDILFISDIRTADTKTQDQELIELMVLKDNMKQKDWINIMKPKKSLLKFRCPYPDRKNGKKNLVMFKGDIYLQPFAGSTSTETRLIPQEPLVEVEYDNEKYEEQLCYHNDEIRRREFPQPIPDGEGFNRRWDISAEIVILYDFLMKYPNFYSELGWFDKIKKFSQDISYYCTMTTRNLKTPMLHPERRRKFAPKDHTSFYPDLQK